ncbi:MAG: putative heme-binding protein, partial [Phycisphaerales bacterium]|nr:putative heme-binding protein [Phycisphaerales bacterium]
MSRNVGSIVAAAVVAISLLAPVRSVASSPASTPATGPAADPNALFARGNIAAWCVVPYDGLHRTPEQRADMLVRLGFRHFAYDWRAKHLPTFGAELDALAARGVHLDGVWFPDALNADATFILKTLGEHKVRTQLWVMTGAGNAGSPSERLAAAADRLRPVAAAAAAVGCTVGLYNHGGWAAEPANMTAIVSRLKSQGVANVGIVYNLSHGYGDLGDFADRFRLVLPHLLAVNLNGTSPLPPGVKGDPIVPLGCGSMDVALLKTIRDSGYAGPIGIINESDEDAAARLLDNLDGLDWLLPQLDARPPAGPRPPLRSWRDPARAAAAPTSRP